MYNGRKRSPSSVFEIVESVTNIIISMASVDVKSSSKICKFI